MLSMLIHGSSSLREYCISHARTYIMSVLSKGVRRGELVIIDNSGSYIFGSRKDGEPNATITVLHDSFWFRLFLTNDLGFAESFLLGEVKTEDLKPIYDLWLQNSASLTGLSTVSHMIYSAISKVVTGFLGQSVSQAKLNAVVGYDESNSLFKAFLSKEMMYSCALWSDDEGGVQGDLTGHEVGKFDLEASQKRKIHHVLKMARVKKGDRILEFGSGWCGLAIEAVREYGCTVDTLTLSIAQKTLGEERIHEAGLSSWIRVHLLDYRQLPASFEKAFDRFISIEMIEHVGPRYYNKFFEVVNWALKSEHAAAVISSSTMPEVRYGAYQPPDFSRYYIWPNGTLPSATALVIAARTGSDGQLNLDTIENHGKHYARTLREWGRRFKANVKDAVVMDILQERPDLKDEGRMELFKRKWLYLFAYAEAGFASGYVTCHMLTFVRDRDSVSM